MRFLSEYRDAHLVRATLDEIAVEADRPRVLMEICGGQTHSLVRSGLDRLLPETVTLVHGPGCPVCVTPITTVDRALALARRSDVTFVSFGDMLRVPGTAGDLFTVRAEGGDVRVVYSPLDAVRLAGSLPEREVVFFAIGFETTAPANAAAVLESRRRGLENFSILASHACVPGAIRAVLAAPANRVEGFLAAGHVCAVMGIEEYEPIAREFRVPIVVTGFEPLDLARGILAALRQLREGRAEVENAYARVVPSRGNLPARALLRRVFEPCDREWRGMGTIPRSGLRLREEFARFDAERRFDLSGVRSEDSGSCRAGDVLRGLLEPGDCPAFGEECTPSRPLGAPMVSSEGACSAYYRYRRDPTGEGARV